MFSKTLVAIAACAAVAVATPWNNPPPTKTVTVTATSTATQPASQCSSGDVQCCDTVTNSGSPAASSILGLLGVVVQGLNVPVGLTCTPISVIGVGGTACQSNAVCCENNSFNGLIAIGCTPVNLAL